MKKKLLSKLETCILVLKMDSLEFIKQILLKIPKFINSTKANTKLNERDIPIIPYLYSY